MSKSFLRIGLFFGFTAILFAGCNDDPAPAEAYPDVYVRSMMSEGSAVYAVAQMVTSYTAMDTVIVTGPVGAPSLKSYDNTHLSFVNEPASEDYEVTPPMSGTYTYNVKFSNGEELSVSNSITSPFVAPAQNMAVVEVTENNVTTVKLTWDAVANTDYYSIKATQGTTTIYSLSGSLEIGKNGEVRFPISGFSAYIPGTINFEVVAIDQEEKEGYVNSLSTATTSLYMD
jgi:hypothetical protein